MGTEEKDPELAAQPKEQESPEKEKELHVESPQGATPENTDPLNTYKWHTGSKGTLDEPKEEAETGAAASSTIDKIQKASSNKWSKMQNWRKALSEDTGEKASHKEGAKADKGAGGGRKNPFRRALSEPPGSLFAALSPSSASTSAASSSAAPAEASGVSSSADPSQRTGGVLKKYLRTVSQKLKRPRLQTRCSASALLQDVAESEPAVPVELPRLPWVPPQEVPLWDISNCMLEDGQILISPEEEPTMWTRNRVSSYLSNVSLMNLMDIDSGQHTHTEIKLYEKQINAVKTMRKHQQSSSY